MKKFTFAVTIMFYLLGLLSMPALVFMMVELIYKGSENLDHYHLFWMALIIGLPGLVSPALARGDRRSRKALFLSVIWFFAVTVFALYLINMRQGHSPMVGYSLLIITALAPGLTGLLSFYNKKFLRKITYIVSFVYIVLMLKISMT